MTAHTLLNSHNSTDNPESDSDDLIFNYSLPVDNLDNPHQQNHSDESVPPDKKKKNHS